MVCSACGAADEVDPRFGVVLCPWVGHVDSLWLRRVAVNIVFRGVDCVCRSRSRKGSVNRVEVYTPGSILALEVGLCVWRFDTHGEKFKLSRMTLLFLFFRGRTTQHDTPAVCRALHAWLLAHRGEIRTRLSTARSNTPSHETVGTGRARQNAHPQPPKLKPPPPPPKLILAFEKSISGWACLNFSSISCCFS